MYVHMPTVGYGQTPKDEKGVFKPTTQSLKLNGSEGVWFPQSKARKLLKDVATLEGTKRILNKTEGLLSLEKRRSSLLEKNVQTALTRANIWKKTAQEQAELNKQDKPWWKSPSLWGLVGFGVGMAITVTIFSVAEK
jgi:hypothetical protein